MFKKLCNVLKYAIIGVADEVLICISWDTEKSWVLKLSHFGTLLNRRANPLIIKVVNLES